MRFPNLQSSLDQIAQATERTAASVETSATTIGRTLERVRGDSAKVESEVSSTARRVELDVGRVSDALRGTRGEAESALSETTAAIERGIDLTVEAAGASTNRLRDKLKERAEEARGELDQLLEELKRHESEFNPIIEDLFSQIKEGGIDLKDALSLAEKFGVGLGDLADLMRDIDLNSIVQDARRNRQEFEAEGIGFARALEELSNVNTAAAVQFEQALKAYREGNIEAERLREILAALDEIVPEGGTVDALIDSVEELIREEGRRQNL